MGLLQELKILTFASIGDYGWNMDPSLHIEIKMIFSLRINNKKRKHCAFLIQKTYLKFELFPPSICY